MAEISVLVVEDNPINLKLAEVVLSKQGYNVKTASDADEASEVLKRFHPVVILMDLQLPGMDGLELTKILKKDTATKDISIIALTAHAMRGDEERAIEAGCDGYITKPYDTHTLSALIKEILEKRSQS
ncbi:MAG: response regulator [Gammaproteobacteria bacterium]|nr:response regulator [Gammaproteobacteria bacterium]